MAATLVNRETARRYLSGKSSPSAEFIAAVCLDSGFSAQWVLTGEGPELWRDRLADELRSAPANELMKSVAARIEKFSTVTRPSENVSDIESRTERSLNRRSDFTVANNAA